jgi:hypothetical protein
MPLDLDGRLSGTRTAEEQLVARRELEQDATHQFLARGVGYDA